ncbi:MAG: hypothetical protein J5I81_09995 [Nitrococcus mobilis]|nr:hypothetical protein [Nitrococcus mobilis]
MRAGVVFTQTAWTLRCLGALLMFPPAHLYAQVHGLEVRPVDYEVRSEEPRHPVTIPFHITNATGRHQTLQARPVMPRQWRLITPELPFELAAGETTVRFVSFFIPEGTPAGDYPFTYEVSSRQQPAVRDAYTISIQIAPMPKLQVAPVQVPELIIAGDPYWAAFLIRNSGNVPLMITYAAQHSQAVPLAPESGRLHLAPGESKRVEVEVKTKPVEQPENDWLTVKAGLEEKKITKSITRPVRILPRVSGYEQRYHTLPAVFRVIGVMQERKGARHLGWQAELSGYGTLDEAGRRHIDFLFRGPDLRGEAIFGQIDEYRINYSDERWAMSLGDQVYGLSPLTELFRYGRGARAGYDAGQWGVQSYYMQDRFTTEAQEEIAVNAHYTPRPWTRLEVNYLNKQGPLASKARWPAIFTACAATWDGRRGST